MASISVYPDKVQFKVVTAFLKAIGVKFEINKEEALPPHVKEGLARSQKDYAEGRYKTYTGINDLFAK